MGAHNSLAGKQEYHSVIARSPDKRSFVPPPRLSFRYLQFTLRHKEELHSGLPIEAAEEGGGGAFGQFVAFGRLLPVTIRFAQWVLHNRLPDETRQTFGVHGMANA